MWRPQSSKNVSNVKKECLRFHLDIKGLLYIKVLFAYVGKESLSILSSSFNPPQEISSILQNLKRVERHLLGKQNWGVLLCFYSLLCFIVFICLDVTSQNSIDGCIERFRLRSITHFYLDLFISSDRCHGRPRWYFGCSEQSGFNQPSVGWEQN